MVTNNAESQSHHSRFEICCGLEPSGRTRKLPDPSRGEGFGLLADVSKTDFILRTVELGCHHSSRAQQTQATSKTYRLARFKNLTLWSGAEEPPKNPRHKNLQLERMTTAPFHLAERPLEILLREVARVRALDAHRARRSSRQPRRPGWDCECRRCTRRWLGQRRRRSGPANRGERVRHTW